MEVELIVDLEYVFKQEQGKYAYHKFEDVHVALGIGPREWDNLTQEERDKHVDAIMWEKSRVYHKIKHTRILYDQQSTPSETR